MPKQITGTPLDQPVTQGGSNTQVSNNVNPLDDNLSNNQNPVASDPMSTQTNAVNSQVAQADVKNSVDSGEKRGSSGSTSDQATDSGDSLADLAKKLSAWKDDFMKKDGQGNAKEKENEIKTVTEDANLVTDVNLDNKDSNNLNADSDNAPGNMPATTISTDNMATVSDLSEGALQNSEDAGGASSVSATGIVSNTNSNVSDPFTMQSGNVAMTESAPAANPADTGSQADLQNASVDSMDVVAQANEQNSSPDFLNANVSSGDALGINNIQNTDNNSNNVVPDAMPINSVDSNLQVSDTPMQMPTAEGMPAGTPNNNIANTIDTTTPVVNSALPLNNPQVEENASEINNNVFSNIPVENNVATPALTNTVVENNPVSSNEIGLPGGAKPVVSNKKYPYSIHDLLHMVVEKDASDLHITVGYPAMLRVDGSLQPVGQELISEKDSTDLILPVLDESKRELLEVNREVDLAYAFEDIARFRINAYYERGNPAAAFRLIPSRIKTIEELKLPGIFHQFSKIPQGFVLVTGPTGSGKSTTLAAILQEINANRPCHIITIEDPIEYLYPVGRALIDQREMHEDTHSWEIAMRSALRQDPDVVLVGEMRDYETISAAITLAETGHLVFATLHTNNAAQTIDRIIDVFPEHQQEQVRTQLANIVEAVIAQRLLPVQGGGRRAVNEILLVTPAVRNLIREGKTHQIDNVIRTSMDIGMKSLEHSLVDLVREGAINVDLAESSSVHPEEIARLLK